MIIRALKEHYILAKDSGPRRAILIPRTELRPSDATTPIKLCRRIFPKRMTFLMTINMAQKQTLIHGGIYSTSRNFTTTSSMRHFSYPVLWRTSMLQLLKGIEDAEKIIASSTSISISNISVKHKQNFIN
jgi:hypothetical protein